MKTLVIGGGGIGGRVVEMLDDLRSLTKLDGAIADGDIIEFTQIKPIQNFEMEDIGKNKAEVLGKRFNFKAIPSRIERQLDLRTFDFIICCADNEATRNLVVKHCFENQKEFLILRATGRNASAFPKANKIEDNQKFVDPSDKKEYSCQKGDFCLGFVIAATIGVQMYLNHLRGIKNTPINIRI